MNPETIYSFIASVLIVGLLYFILYNAVNNSNYMKKGIIFLVFGLIIFGATLAGIISDADKGTALSLRYLAFPIVNLMYLVIFSIYNFSCAFKYRHKLVHFTKVKNTKLVNYLYLVFRYEDFYLLDGKENKKGFIIKFDKDTSYHDEMIEKFIKDTNISIYDKKYVGKVIKNDKLESTYYCYRIEVLELSNFLNSLEQVNKFEIYQQPMLDFDKEVILKMLISKSSDPFVINK